MNVLENILIACERCHWWSYVSDLFRPGRPKLSAFATATIEGLGLTADLDRRPTELPFGRRRLVALARAIAAEPSILLLDEPATGLSEQERTELTALIRSLATDRGMGVLLVEHDVEVVMRSCDRIVVLDFGRMTASGTPAAVRKNPDVVRAYLGAPADELAANTGTNAGTDTDTSASEREEVS
jgi:ABC-type branched-subunit amino acid transport system ATPase component